MTLVGIVALPRSCPDVDLRSQLQPKELLLPSGLSAASHRLLTRHATAASLRVVCLKAPLAIQCSLRGIPIIQI